MLKTPRVPRPKSEETAPYQRRLFIHFLYCLPLALLVACDAHKPKPACADYFEVGDKGYYDTTQHSLAIDRKNGTIWYRCPAGMTFLHHRCKGDIIYATWDQAMAFAEEFSLKVGSVWRLPTKGEMKSISESNCVAPTLNTNVFPAAEVANFWTASSGLHQDQFRCSFNSYNGSLSCRQARFIQQPFMLVRD